MSNSNTVYFRAVALTAIVFVAVLLYIPATAMADSYSGPSCPGGIPDGGPYIPALSVYSFKDWGHNIAPKASQSSCKAIEHVSRFYLSDNLSKNFVLVQRPQLCDYPVEKCEIVTFSIYKEGSANNSFPAYNESGVEAPSLFVIPDATAQKLFLSNNALALGISNSRSLSGVERFHQELKTGTLYEYFPLSNQYYYKNNSTKYNPDMDPYRQNGTFSATSTPVGTLTYMMRGALRFASSTNVMVADNGLSISGKNWQNDLVPIVNPVGKIDTTYVITKSADGKLITVPTLTVTEFSDGTRRFTATAIPTTGIMSGHATSTSATVTRSWWKSFWCSITGFFGRAC